MIVRSHDDGNCSITGGVVVRDRSLAGACAGATCSATSARGASSRRGSRRAGRAACGATSLKVESLSSFGEDARGRVYVVVAERAGLPDRPALSAMEVLLVRAANPSPYTLDGTNTWVVGRDPAWVVDPGPALTRTSTPSPRRWPSAAARAGSR